MNDVAHWMRWNMDSSILYCCGISVNVLQKKLINHFPTCANCGTLTKVNELRIYQTRVRRSSNVDAINTVDPGNKAVAHFLANVIISESPAVVRPARPDGAHKYGTSGVPIRKDKSTSS
jgi:hypothetical protein